MTDKVIAHGGIYMERYASNGVLPPVPENPRIFKKHTQRQLVVKTNHAPNNYNEASPNPSDTFKGVDGRWYKFIVPAFMGNCYAFALGIIYDAKNTGYYVPGFLVERYPLSKEEVPTLIIRDLEVLGRKVHEVIMFDDIPETLPKAAPNTYWVKVMFADNLTNFHIARLDEVSGRWIHVMGWNNPPKVFMRNLETTNPVQEQLNMLINTGSIPNGVSHDEVIEYVKMIGNSMGIDLRPYVSKSNYEIDARASYYAYNPNKKPDGFIEYKTYAVMRIDY